MIGSRSPAEESGSSHWHHETQPAWVYSIGDPEYRRVVLKPIEVDKHAGEAVLKGRLHALRGAEMCKTRPRTRSRLCS